MLLSLFRGEFTEDVLVIILLSLPVILISLTVHEVSHGYIAYKCGDGTAKAFGRLTLNPIKHLDPFGALAMLLIGFGWAKPVPVNMRNFRKPRRDIALVSLAGPISNLLLALISALIYIVLLRIFYETSDVSGFASFLSLSTFLEEGVKVGKDILIYDQASLFGAGTFFGFSSFQVVLLTVFQLMTMLNVGLAVFNLIPLPPLDGSKILASILPPHISVRYLQIEQYTRFIFLFLILATRIDGIRELIMNLYMHIFWFIL